MLRLEKVSRVYRTRRGDVKALDKVSLNVNEGEFVVVRGPSGSGKTTLLLSIGGMLRPTEGQVIADGSDIYAMSERDRARFRAKNIGFVFQLFHLVPYLNIIENVFLPAGVVKNRSRLTGARELLKRLNLSEREYHKPLELSAGERQRTAIARALLNQPRIILADEPTGNLDPENADQIFGHLAEYQRSGGTVIVVSHGTAADRFADRIIHLGEGRIEESL